MHGICSYTFCFQIGMTKRHLKITAYLYVRSIINPESLKIFYVISYPGGLSQLHYEFESYRLFMIDSLLKICELT
jgi:hypothetical protein